LGKMATGRTTWHPSARMVPGGSALKVWDEGWSTNGPVRGPEQSYGHSGFRLSAERRRAGTTGRRRRRALRADARMPDRLNRRRVRHLRAGHWRAAALTPRRGASRVHAHGQKRVRSPVRTTEPSPLHAATAGHQEPGTAGGFATCNEEPRATSRRASAVGGTAAAFGREDARAGSEDLQAEQVRHRHQGGHVRRYRHGLHDLYP